MKNTKGQIHLLLQLIDEAYKSQAWHGTNLRGSIRGLTSKQAAWRPDVNCHNIWEIVIHTAYWKYIVRRRLLGGKKRFVPSQRKQLDRTPLNVGRKSMAR
jgi:hypothetical protein